MGFEQVIRSEAVHVFCTRAVACSCTALPYVPTSVATAPTNTCTGGDILVVILHSY